MQSSSTQIPSTQLYPSSQSPQLISSLQLFILVPQTHVSQVVSVDSATQSSSPANPPSISYIYNASQTSHCFPFIIGEISIKSGFPEKLLIS